MNSKVKTILLTVTATTMALLLVVGLILSHHTTSHPLCREMTVNLSATADSLGMDSEEVAQWLQGAGLYPVGRPTDQIATAAIEQQLILHPLVRSAECYLTPSAVCRLDVRLRQPVYRVVTPAESYLVDADRQRMPLRNRMHLHLLSATGNIGSRMASEELYDLMDFLSSSRYWQPLMGHVEVTAPNMSALILRDGRRVILGPITDYADKLGRLRTMWEATEDYPAAQAGTYDLRYAHQVITR